MDAEVWMTGTPAQVAILLNGIRQVVNVYYLGEQVKLGGTDAGRVRQYARVVPAARYAEEKPKKRGRGRKKPQDFEDVALPEGDQS